jgi:hypothetical protein
MRAARDAEWRRRVRQFCVRNTDTADANGNPMHVYTGKQRQTSVVSLWIVDAWGVGVRLKDYPFVEVTVQIRRPAKLAATKLINFEREHQVFFITP